MRKQKKPFAISLTLEQLNLIAQYYQFSSTVFFMDMARLKRFFAGKTRTEVLDDAYRRLQKIKEIVNG